MTEISSASNPHFKRFLSLTTSRGLKKEGLFLLSGQSLVREFLAKPSLELLAELIPPGKKAKTMGKVAYQLTRPLFDEIDVLGTHENILVLKQPVLPKWTGKSQDIGLTVLLPLGDPGNLGSVLRSCEAFGVEDVVLLNESAHPFLPKSIKASAGSSWRLRLQKGPSIHELSEMKIKNLITLDMSGEALSEFSWPSFATLVVGEEGAGIPDSLLKKCRSLRIPTENVESLNASVAVSITLFDRTQRQGIKRF